MELFNLQTGETVGTIKIHNKEKDVEFVQFILDVIFGKGKVGIDSKEE